MCIRDRDKATLNKMVFRSLNLQASFNYERMQAAGWLYLSLIHICFGVPL